nr:(2Fe-2S)-binding protein [Entomobacter blattae]
MYICSCNTITDKDIDTAIQAGAKKPKDIYASCGGKVQCGQCVRTMANYIRGTLSTGEGSGCCQEQRCACSEGNHQTGQEKMSA